MKRTLLMGIFLAFLFFGIPQIFGNGAGQVVVYLLIGGVGIGMIFYMRWFQKFAKQVNALLPLLTEDPDRYIQETEKFLEGRKPANIRAMLKMNIAAAYSEKGDYQTAKSKLKEINGAALKGANASVYFLNLTYILICIGENANALELIRKYKKQFASLPMGGNLPHLNGFVSIFETMENSQWDAAKEKMQAAKEAWPEKVPGVDFSVLEKRLNAHFGSNAIEEKTAPELLPQDIANTIMDAPLAAEFEKSPDE